MFSSALQKNVTPKRLFTQLELENYVQKVQSRLQSPLEKKSKAFAFARLYYDAKDYDTAKRYLKEYLSIQDRDFRVYNLLGAVQESLENYQEALASYKRSLELCSSQKDILIKVIKMCCKCQMDPLRAKVWADKGERLCPGHPEVFRLRWHLMSSEDPKNHDELETLIADELTRHPRDSSLHQKLVENYVEAGSYQEAFFHCQSVEKTGAFNDSIEWLECACDTFDTYQQQTDDDRINAYLSFTSALCKLMRLHLRKSSSRVCMDTFIRFDKTVQILQSLEPQDIFSGMTSELKDCITEMRGQLYLNAAVFLMKLAQENLIPWMKANRMMYAYLMCSWLVPVPVVTPKLFARHSPLKRQNPQAYNWSVLACTRLSQAGHIILSLESEFGEEWQQDCINDLCTDQGQNTILEFLYNGGDRLEDSYLAGDRRFLETEFQLPDTQLLVKYDEVTVAENAQDLHLIIWLGLHWDQFREQMRPGVGVMVGRLFEGITLDVKNMNNCHHSSMCLRDVEAFIYGVIRSSKSIHIECYKGEDELKLLPLDICTSLVTEPQQEWWHAAYSLYTGKVGSQSPAKLKVVLQKGLETLRCLKDHGIDPRVLIYMSLAFWEKADAIQATKEKEYDYQDHWKSLQERAVYYMKEAIRILEIFKRNKTIPICESPLIPPLSEPLLIDEVLQLLNKNFMKLGDVAMIDGNLHDALKYYDEVKTLVSTYNQAQIYIRLASKCDLQTVDGEKDHLYYITKAKERLNVCINHSDHSPEFKQSLYEQLHELTMNAIPSATSAIPLAKKSLHFQTDHVPDADIEDGESTVSNPLDVSSLMEKSLLQEQLDAKENENRSLKQALAMYKAQIEMQRQGSIPPPPPQAHPQQYYHQAQMTPGMMHGMPPAQPGIPPLMPQSPHMVHAPSAMMPQVHMPPNPGGAPMHPQGGQVYGPPNMVPPQHWPRGASFGSNPMTPPVLNGMETPSDLWWDSFSPQPSFEKGYFAGLAQHVEQVREESGEGEAPTLRDGTEPTTPVNPDDVDAVYPGVGVATPKSPAAVEVDDIYVEPIVKLEEKKSDLTTGEEDETPKFVHRAKLYRFDEDAAQWKERGIGDVKLLFNDKTKKARITMRRDQVFRVCCNHMITPEMKLAKKEGSASAWSWFTPLDATDNQPEKFTIKFKTQDIADEFYEAFMKCQKLSTGEIVEEPHAVPKKVNNGLTKSAVAQQISKQAAHPPPSYQDSVGAPAQSIVPQGMIDLSASMQGQNLAYVNSLNNAFHAPQPTAFGYQTPPLQAPFQQQGPMARLTHYPPAQPTVNPVQFGTATVVPNQQQQPKPAFLSTMQPSNAEEAKQPEAAKPNPFAGFSFNMKSTPTKTPTTVSGEASVAPVVTNASPFSSFSFSSVSATTTPTSATVSPFLAQQTTSTMPMEFPMMTSLLQDKQQQQQQQPQQVSKPTSAAKAETPPVSISPAGSPSKTVITGMNKLPVFEKGIVDSSIDPSAFWSNVSPGKSFFTGNTTALETIGHTEAPEPREVDEDEFFKENIEAENEEVAENDGEYDENKYYGVDEYYGKKGEYYGEKGEYYGEKGEYYGEKGGYYGENGEYYDEEGNLEDYDYDPDDDFCYEDDEEDDADDDDDDEYQPSKASSSRRASDEEFDQSERYRSGNKQVEDRFDIQRKSPQGNHDHVINDDITITFENIPSFAQKIKASRLQLPSTFFLYESKPPCTGCTGCGGEDLTTIQGDPTMEIRAAENSAMSAQTAAPQGFTFGGQPQQSGSSFAALASSFGSTTAAFSGTAGSFSGAGAQLFGAKGEGVNEVNNDHDPQYDAIVQVAKLDSVKTGEEDDEVLFKHRAKLYRFDSQWKERGVGDIKLTKNVKSGYCRVLMRRDHIHKLCANHAVSPHMELKPLMTSDTSWVWFTPSDYSDEQPTKPQQFCVKFKHKDVSVEFRNQFLLCQQMMEKVLVGTNAETGGENQQQQGVDKQEGKLPLPFKGKSEPTSSPFASLKLFGNNTTNTATSFGTSAVAPESSTTSTAETTSADPTSPGYYKDEDPDIHVDAIVQVSKLSALATGEENEEALFEGRSKLYRFDSNTKSWKERGIGTLKLAWDHNKNTCRVLMRREQIHKLCANHAIIDSMELKQLNNSDKAWTWFTQADISDGEEPRPENFCAKFKTPEIAQQFESAFEKCKNIVSGKTLKEDPASETKSTNNKPGNSLAARFAPKPGSWSCQTCLVDNPPTAEKCLACQTPNPDLKPTTSSDNESKSSNEKSVFAFTSPHATNIFGNTNGFSFGNSSGPSFNLGATTEQHQQASDGKPSAPAVFSFGQQKPVTTNTNAPVFSFGSSAPFSSSKTPFSFGGQSAAESNQSNTPFSFGGQSAAESNQSNPPFSFGSQSVAESSQSNAPFSLGSQPVTESNQSNTLFSFGGQSIAESSQSNAPFSFVQSTAAASNSNAPSFSFPGFSSVSGELTKDGTLAKEQAGSTTTSRPNNQETSKQNIFTKFAQKPGSWECSTCLVMNEENDTQCIACTTPNPAGMNKNTSNSQFSSPFTTIGSNQGAAAKPVEKNVFAKFAQKPGSWECSTCLVVNEENDTQCIACTTPNPAAKKENISQFLSPFGNVESSQDAAAKPAKQNVFAKFAQKPGSWECSTCLVVNEENDTQCIACTTPNPAAKKENVSQFSSLFGNVGSSQDAVSKPAKQNVFAKFAQKPGSWECSTCLVVNKESETQCIACTTPNPNANTEDVCNTSSNQFSGFSFGAGSTNPPSGSSGFTFGGGASDAHSSAAFSFGTMSSGSSKPSELAFGGGGGSTSAVSSTIATNNAGFSFGTPTTQPPAATTSSGFSFGLPAKKEDVPNNEVSSTTTGTNENTPVETTTTDAGKLKLKGKFTPPAGSWECPTCMINNKPTHSKCAACQTSNPKAVTNTGDESTTTAAGQTSASAFSFGAKPSSSSTSFGFPFGGTTQPSGFTFGESATPKTSSSGFSFGSKPQSSPFSFPTVPATNATATPETKTAIPVDNFSADPDTWECVCLGKNAGHREVCRLCQAPRQKTPVVRLNPDDHSKPISFTSAEQSSAEKLEAIIVPNISATAPAVSTGFSFGSTTPAIQSSVADSTNQNIGFAWGQSHLPKLDSSITMTKEEKDRELMPPPSSIPTAKTKTSPKLQSSTKRDSQESIFSWMPKGLSTDTLFNFGTTPTPSLSNASSVDDLSSERTEAYKTVAPAFTNTQFSFTFETPKKGDPPPSIAVSPPSKTPPSFKATIQDSVASPTSPDGPCDGEPNIEFTPLVTLSQVNVQNTGEEHDIKMFGERCKMFRFVETQWKERGVGELKILRSELTNQWRLVMRRDQIHKLCANHMIVQGMDIKPMKGSTKAFVWKTTADISDGEPQEQMFAARFKDEAIAKKFSEVFTEATLSKPVEVDVALRNPVADAVPSKSVNDSTSSKPVEDTTLSKTDVIVISDDEKDEKEPTQSPTTRQGSGDVQLTFQPSLSEDLKEKAKRLLLPSTFYHAPSVKVGHNLPTKTVGLSSSSTLDSGNTTEAGHRMPDLLLTREKESSSEGQQKARDLLLPKTFYNNGDATVTSTKNIPIAEYSSDDESVNQGGDGRVFNVVAPFSRDRYENIIFNDEVSVFKYSPASKLWNQLDNSRVLIVSQMSLLQQNRSEIVFVANENVFLQKTVNEDLFLEFRPGQPTMLDLVISGKTPKTKEQKYALQFEDTPSAENFKRFFIDLQSGKPAPTPTVTSPFNSNNQVFGSSTGGNSLFNSNSPPVFGTSKGGISFAALAAGGNSEFKSNAGQVFAGAGASLFGGGASRKTDGDTNEDRDAEDSSHDVYVEPIVQLATVAVSSGEENEDTFFNQRCKLYRFDSAVKKWKERGVGEMKLLRHRDTRKARLVMRRDQVRKICANHLLQPTIELKPFATNDLTVTWTAFQDISEERAEDVLLAAKFKNNDILSEFKTVFTLLCNDNGDDDLQPLDCSYQAEDGSQMKARLGACDPKLAEAVRDLKF